MSVWYNFVTVDVFTTTPYEGNPLAIVLIPKDSSITQEQKTKIAKEFNLSETVFLHEDPGSGIERRFDIFTILGEIPWAGHPTIGTICYIASMESGDKGPESFTLKAKAGPLRAKFDPSRLSASAKVPINFHVHAKGVSSQEFLKSQPVLQKQLKTVHDAFPIASIVDGMNFVLAELSSLEELSLVHNAAASISFAKDNLDSGWTPGLVAAYFFTILSDDNGVTKVRTRMIESDIGEDPATGSAASDLACYLATKKVSPNLKQVFEIEQGVEMGRRSLIRIEVELDHEAQIKQVLLSGQAVKIQEGRILV